ncbi:hypothetical protein ACIQCF_25890 [Streptomyces sp. NPDC088353]|uniref:hypothetical protein n=1 Tax=Streptomyces sp. NPDC088353 TaxID=3365855 RepID=UPI0037F7EF18
MNAREPLYGRAADAVRDQLREPGELDVAVNVARDMLTAYADVDHGDIFALNQAHGALRESLRILLRAVGAEPDGRSEGWTSMTNVQVPDQERNRSEGRTATMAVRPPSVGAEPRTAGRGRCPAAHPDDPTPCGGPVVVTVLDRQNAGADGCEHHGARLLASLKGGRVYPLPDAPDAAIRVFKAADTIRPFPWLTGAPRTEPSQLSNAENLRRGDAR